MQSSEQASGPMVQGTPSTRKAGLQRGVVLGIASFAIGFLTTMSGAVIELASSMLADLRHGICLETQPGDTQPLWDATFGGGFRPYDRMRCCGGSASVDHATQECRKLSIIKHSTRKRLAIPMKEVQTFGQALREEEELPVTAFSLAELGHREPEVADAAAQTRHRSHVGLNQQKERLHSHHARAAQLRELVGADASRVRAHMSHLFSPDPGERWAEESSNRHSRIHQTSLAEQMVEEKLDIAVNDGVVQTQTESAGSTAPIYEWVPWERILMARGPTASMLIYVVGTGLLGLCAALVTRCRPPARGSGIPEVKAAAAGFAIPASFQGRTLLAKVIALSLCVGAGLAVGKEGPMIHIGACWSMVLAVPLSKLLQHGGAPIEETDLLCIGCAAGVAAAFGAPLGGVLFVVEELGAAMPTGLKYSTMICALGSALIAALTLKSLDLTRTQRLTLFEVDYKNAWAPWEALPFCLLGIVGGVVGGLFVLANGAVHRCRLRAEKEGRAFWYLPSSLSQWTGGFTLGIDARIFEVVLLAVFTGLSNYPFHLTRMLQNDAIKALFSQCPATPGLGHDPVGLCEAEDVGSLSTLLRLLLGASLLRFLQTTVTFGALTPAGLFVPSLYMGGCVGRALGALLNYAGLHSSQGLVEPGIYAMVGAGAVLSGVSRLTLSLAVVLFELTGGLTYVVPFMLAVLIAKWTGDAISNHQSIYDVHADLKGFTKVEAPDDVRLLNATLSDIRGQTHEHPALIVSAGSVVWGSDVLAHCRTIVGGFAVVSVTTDDKVEVLGWMRSSRVVELLSGQATINGGLRADQWFHLLPGQQRAQKPGGILDDLSQVIERDGVVHVRADCPVQTAFCIFQNRPRVRALVSIDGSPREVTTVTREFFIAQLVQGCLCPCPLSKTVFSNTKLGFGGDGMPESRGAVDSLVDLHSVKGSLMAERCSVAEIEDAIDAKP